MQALIAARHGFPGHREFRDESAQNPGARLRLEDVAGGAFLGALVVASVFRWILGPQRKAQKQDSPESEEFTMHDRVPPFHALADRKSTRLNSSHRCISYAVFSFKNLFASS